MRKIVTIFLTILSILVLSACSTLSDGKYGMSEDMLPGEGDEDNEQYQIQPGQLTASEWKDLDNYEFYLDLFKSSDNESGAFSQFVNNQYFDLGYKVTVEVINNDTIIRNARVELINDNDEVITQSITDHFGKAHLFPTLGDLDTIKDIRVTYKDKQQILDYTYDSLNNYVIINLDALHEVPNILEIMFVIDTTGSMSDEIRYLQTEIDDVINKVKDALSDVEIRLALLFYRDKGDDYITKYYDFTTDIDNQKEILGKQKASGGGDYEEAVDIALDEAVKKQWSIHTTKLLFHVLDAPPHDKEQDMNRYKNAIHEAANKGIRMIPIASSGVDVRTEYLLRAEAMLTSGTYVFLTNDSGIGHEKLEASVGETVVEYLNNLLVRLILEYQTGVVGEKIPYYDTNQQN